MFRALGDALVCEVGAGHEIEVAKALSIGGEHACGPASYFVAGNIVAGNIVAPQATSKVRK